MSLDNGLDFGFAPSLPMASSSSPSSTSASAPPGAAAAAAAAAVSETPSPADKSLTLTHLCPQCGTGVEAIPLALDDHGHNVAARRRIQDLEQELSLLNGKATAAVDRLADTEEELKRLRAAQPANNAFALLTPPVDASPPRSVPQDDRDASAPSTPPRPLASDSTLRRATSMRFSFLRKTSASSSTLPPESSAQPVAVDPTNAFHLEQTRRLAAEAKLMQLNGELEELSVTLFQQANDMVAGERRERAQAEERAEARAQSQDDRIQRLEERIRILEERDRERAKRLEMLERGMRRVGRVKGVLGRS